MQEIYIRRLIMFFEFIPNSNLNAYRLNKRDPAWNEQRDRKKNLVSINWITEAILTTIKNMTAGLSFNG
jgi:hypothetical protein